MNRRRILVIALLAATPVETLGAQRPAAEARAPAHSLTLRGLDGHTRELTANDLASFARHDTLVSAHHIAGRFSGVSLVDLLALIRAAAGDSLRGVALRTYVRIEGADGYAIILALAELDTSFTDRTVILADRKDGVPLAAKDGPYQLIIPGDKRPARWVRQVVRISLERAP